MTDLGARLAYVDARLEYEIDAVAAHDAVAAGEVLLVDTRRLESWQHGHIAGAVHLPQSEIASGIESLPRDRTLVVYGWGPGCNGATATARVLLAAGLDVRELLGGFEYWVRNGFEVEGALSRQEPDPLVTAES
ncbi:sulfurtransferase [Microbacterium sp. ISL-59]|uniref:rhodanese-like domain-containing protein n=1 Tax=Microbacterium sp. ISL-59 TaxID=2819159 RepID=UPI001BEC6D03|nr:rhodanese-like domain-containing protein [Microbacterium sp. ISL-59]MBT2495818.1 sulfurtransferase [Microbacterium sp. ISL-59]